MDQLRVEAPDPDSAISLIDQIKVLHCELLPGEDGRCEVQVEFGDGRGQEIKAALDAVERWLTTAGIQATRVKLSHQTYVVERRAESSRAVAARI